VNKRKFVAIGAVAGAALILALYALVARAVLSERSFQNNTRDKIAMLETALDGEQGGVQVASTRETELTALQATLEAVEFGFPSEMDSTEVLDYIITAASTHAVNLEQVESRDPVTGTIGSSTYRVFTYDVQVEGELDPIAAFLADLESGDIQTLTLDQINLQAQSTPTTYRAALVVQVYFRH